MTPSTETATLAGGCFWCLEAVYDQLKGVTSVVSGYAGGSVPNPSYEAVCSGRTGHASPPNALSGCLRPATQPSGGRGCRGRRRPAG